jgi:hypothetical protein
MLHRSGFPLCISIPSPSPQISKSPIHSSRGQLVMLSQPVSSDPTGSAVNCRFQGKPLIEHSAGGRCLDLVLCDEATAELEQSLLSYAIFAINIAERLNMFWRKVRAQ